MNRRSASLGCQMFGVHRAGYPRVILQFVLLFPVLVVMGAWSVSAQDWAGEIRCGVFRGGLSTLTARSMAAADPLRMIAASQASGIGMQSAAEVVPLWKAPRTPAGEEQAPVDILGDLQVGDSLPLRFGWTADIRASWLVLLTERASGQLLQVSGLSDEGLAAYQDWIKSGSSVAKCFWWSTRPAANAVPVDHLVVHGGSTEAMQCVAATLLFYIGNPIGYCGLSVRSHPSSTTREDVMRRYRCALLSQATVMRRYFPGPNGGPARVDPAHFANEIVERTAQCAGLS